MLTKLDHVTVGDERIDRTLKALWDNRIGAVYLEHIADVVPFISNLLEDGETVGAGDPRSLVDAGVIKFSKASSYNFLNRSSGKTPQERSEMLRRCLLSDTFFSSANALTERGEIYNVDMQGNRVAAMLYGPRQVVLVVGINKLAPTLDDAVVRVKTEARSPNIVRLKMAASCGEIGSCVSMKTGGASAAGMTRGCAHPDRICCGYTVIAKQPPNHDQRLKGSVRAKWGPVNFRCGAVAGPHVVQQHKSSA